MPTRSDRQPAPDGDGAHVIVDQYGHIRDLHAVNRRLLDPADPDTLRRLLDGLRTLEPDRYWPTTEDAP